MIRLKEIRQSHAVTQIEVATKLGMSHQKYNNYEIGKAEPSISTLIELADYFKVSVDDLVGRPTNMINLSALNETEQYLIKKIIKMNNFEQAKTKAYVMGLTE